MKEKILINYLYKKMKKYIYKSSEKELKRHYDWYQVENGNKLELLEVMFESYYETYNINELKKQILKLEAK